MSAPGGDEDSVADILYNLPRAQTVLLLEFCQHHRGQVVLLVVNRVTRPIPVFGFQVVAKLRPVLCPEYMPSRGSWLAVPSVGSVGHDIDGVAQIKV